MAPDGTISTVAGNGTYGFSGDGGPATEAEFFSFDGIAFGPDDSIYVSDFWSGRVRKITAGIVTTVAGTGVVWFFGGDGGPATEATLNGPEGIAVGPDGSLYIADAYNSRVRRVAPGGSISTVAGNGMYGSSGDVGPATEAALQEPSAVVVGADGNLYILASGPWDARILRVSPNGLITTVGGGGLGASYSLALARDASLYFDLYRYPPGINVVDRISSDGIISTVAGEGDSLADGIPAARSNLWGTEAVAAAPDGSISRSAGLASPSALRSTRSTICRTGSARRLPLPVRGRGVTRRRMAPTGWNRPSSGS